MRKAIVLIANVFILALIVSSCTDNTESAKGADKETKWFGDCEGISNNYGSSKVSGAVAKLLEKKVGRESSYRFWPGNVEVRGNCQFLVTVKAQSDIGRPMEQLKVRIAWDGQDFYLVN